jgi:uncharacterized membrane protein
MKIYLYTLALMILLAFMADVRITLWPFSITFARGWLAIGIILIMCGCICLKAQWYGDGLKRGAEIKEEVREDIKEQKIKESV